MSLSESSLKQYTYHVERLKKISGSSDVSDVSKMIPAVESIRQKNGEPIGLKAKRTYYVALSHFTKSNPEVFLKYKKEYTDINKKLSEDETAPETAIPYSEIKRIGKVIMETESEPLENRILAALTSQIPPLRLDYSRLQVSSSVPESGNYILIGTETKLVIPEHKTGKKHGALERKVPSEIAHLIIRWKTEHKDSVLFDTTENALGKRIPKLYEKYSEKRITMNDIRHSFITQERGGDKPHKEVKALSKLMGHSTGMNGEYRRD